MNFGTQSVFDYVRNMVTDPNCAEEYPVLYFVIRKDCMELLSTTNLPQEDKEDIVQEVQMSVFSGLVDYVEVYASKAPAQRNAYLQTILLRRRNELLRSRYKRKHVSSYDVEDFPVELCGVQDDMFDRLSDRNELTNAFTLICSMKLPAEQIIAYLLGRCTALTGKNSKPALVAQQLAGMTLHEAARYTFDRLQEEFPFPMDRVVFAPLLEKLAETTGQGNYGDGIFLLTPRKISNANSYIAEYLRKHQDRIIGGNSL